MGCMQDCDERAVDSKIGVFEKDGSVDARRTEIRPTKARNYT